MKKNIVPIFILGLLFSLSVLTGCEQLIPDIPTTYVTHPTKVQYTLRYGYQVNCTGSGNYEITYLCDLPEVLHGTVSAQIIDPHGSETISMVNNSFVRWNISDNEEKTYELGILTQVTVESFLVGDLSGEDALQLSDLQLLYPEIVQQYTQQQGNQTNVYIDPSDPEILSIVDDVKTQAHTNNSFLLAKAFFVWLKGHTTYQVHPNDPSVQSARETLEKGTGDCDDLSFVYISLCRSAGIPSRFIRGFLLSKESNTTATAIPHAWSEVFVGGSVGNNGWIPVECACCTTSVETDVHQNFGVENAFHLRLFEDDGSNLSFETSLTGIAYVTYGVLRYIVPTPFATVSGYQELELKKLIVSDDTRQYE